MKSPSPPVRWQGKFNPQIVENGLLLVLMIFTQVLGDLALTQGMKVYGAVETYTLESLSHLFGYLLTSPWVLGGVTLLIVSLFLYFTATSRLDLSLVLPLFSSGYLLNSLLAWQLLGEEVSRWRWGATALITLGVLMVGWSEARPRQSAGHRSPLGLGLLLPVGFSLSRVWAGIWVLVITDAAGDVCIARGMKQLGPIHWSVPKGSWVSIQPLMVQVSRILTQPWVILGITCQALSFGALICLMSWTDISLIRPAGALSYGLSLLGARFILREAISPLRWLGCGIIGGGVALMALEDHPALAFFPGLG